MIIPELVAQLLPSQYSHARSARPLSLHHEDRRLTLCLTAQATASTDAALAGPVCLESV